MFPEPSGASVVMISHDPQLLSRLAGLPEYALTILVVRAFIRVVGKQRCIVGSSHPIRPGMYMVRGLDASRAFSMASITGEMSGVTCWAEWISVSGSAERYVSP